MFQRPRYGFCCATADATASAVETSAITTCRLVIVKSSFLAEGLRPSDSPTRFRLRAKAGRSRGSLAAARSLTLAIFRFPASQYSILGNWQLQTVLRDIPSVQAGWYNRIPMKMSGLAVILRIVSAASAA